MTDLSEQLQHYWLKGSEKENPGFGLCCHLPTCWEEICLDYQKQPRNHQMFNLPWTGRCFNALHHFLSVWGRASLILFSLTAWCRCWSFVIERLHLDFRVTLSPLGFSLPLFTSFLSAYHPPSMTSVQPTNSFEGSAALNKGPWITTIYFTSLTVFHIQRHTC